MPTLPHLIEAAEAKLSQAKLSRYVAECSDDFLYTSGRIRAYDQAVHEAEAEVKRLREQLRNNTACEVS